MKRTEYAVLFVAAALLLAGCGGKKTDEPSAQPGAEAVTGNHKPGPIAGQQTAAADSNEEAIKKEKEKFQGTWNVLSIEIDGKPLPKEFFQAMKYIFEGDKMVVEDQKERLPGGATYQLDPSKEPKAIDAVETYKKKSDVTETKKITGIYAFQGDKLTLCLQNESKERPTAFETKPKDGLMLMVLQRAKP